MRELVVFIPSIENGGVEKNLFLLLSYLSKKIEKIHLVTTSFNLKKKELSRNINIIKPSFHNCNKRGRIFKYFVCLSLLIKHFIGKEIIIFSFQANVFAIFASLFLKAKIVIRLNTSPDKYIHNFLHKKIFKFFYNFSDVIIVNSFSFKKILKEKLNLNSICIYNPVKLKKNIKKRINFFSKFKGLKILSIGRLTSQKDQITILKSAKLLRESGINFKIFIIGQGYKYKSLLKYLTRNKLSKHVKLGGYKSYAQNYIASSDLFILSSKYEGLPNVLIEAQNANVPIISSNCNTGPREILKNGKLGDLFKVGDFYSLYLKIKEFKKNNKRLKIKSNLAKRYLFRFDYNKNSRKYFDVIQQFNK